MSDHTAHILIAEDDAPIREGLIDALESDGHRVTAAVDGREVLVKFETECPDLVILDVMMPKHNGYDVCRAIRRLNVKVPIVMLTAKAEEIDKVLGLQLGADDYVTKPFGVRELLARVEAALRRARVAEDGAPESFSFGDARIDTGKFEATLNDRCQRLTERELHLIKLFHAKPGQVLSRDYLLEQAWGVAYRGTTRTLDQHIVQLRRKIERDPAQPVTILTVHGLGYRFDG